MLPFARPVAEAIYRAREAWSWVLAIDLVIRAIDQSDAHRLCRAIFDFHPPAVTK